MIGCSSVQRIGIALLYKKTTLPKNQIIQNISYHGAGSEPKHRLDLFLPKGTNWPVLVFVHGGGWTSGDKDLRVGSADIYGNIGRFYASRGLGVAIINYRLQPRVNWREQVQDVAKAVAWVHANIAKHGGNSQKIFLAGHSAGAQLISHLALNSKWLTEAGVDEKVISGVISISGAALDLTDEETYRLGENRDYYASRFNDSHKWKQDASPVSYIQTSSPPFLILFGGSEKTSLKRQSYLLHTALSAAHIKNQILAVPGQSHSRIVLTLSRDDKTSGPSILNFIKEHSQKRR
ncbi:MAG: alpha/beta hydrolase [Verrucomicrobiota bacterium]|nr:alpha/beta hydrolase [Verrucomicrobiota bacterium]